MSASPPSNLLPPGVTSLPLTLTTADATTCRWDWFNVSFSQMSQDFVDAGTQHTTTLTNLSGSLTVVPIFVQCSAYASSPPLTLAYRSLPDSGAAPFPRLGNLWGSYNFVGHPEGLAYAASRATLWLGSTWNTSEIAQLRALNPFTIVFTSINACEVNDENLPDDFYLLNVTQPASTRGRLQSWPGAWRLDLTNPRVQQWQANLMYCLVIVGGAGYGNNPSCATSAVPAIIFDGLFIDNVFMDDGASVNSRDIFGNPFYPINQTTGQIMTGFNELWRSGMTAMIDTLRKSLPYGILHGHAMDISDKNISDSFNAMSIGFTAPYMVEQRTDFYSGLALYDSWMTRPTRSPRVTMVESAVRLQLGYGYGFDRDLGTLITRDCQNSNSIPGAPVPGIGDACIPTTPQKSGYMLPQTYLFARSEYQYFRFGLSFTLMRDGYFTHELGDSWHGMDWDYDELHFNLGLALSNATSATVLSPLPPPAPPSIPLSNSSWSLWVQYPESANASWALDSSVKPTSDAPPSARVDVESTAPEAASIDLSQEVDSLLSGRAYALEFWARASQDGVPLHVNARKNGGDWHSAGLDADVVLTSQWSFYNISFLSSSDGSQSRVSWWLGHSPSGASVWINSPSLAGTVFPLPVLKREFECGYAIVNGHAEAVVVDTSDAGTLPRRLSGQQAPLVQMIVDDASSAFHQISGTWNIGNFDSGYDDTNPSSEEVRPPNGFFHHWASGAREAAGGSSASFDLKVPMAGTFNVSMWWPAAVPARTSWATAMRLTINPGGVSVSVDLTTQGGDQWFLIASGVSLSPSSTLQVDCPAGGQSCIADAVLVESDARYNDGSAAEQVSLQPLDGIILQKTSGAPKHCSAHK